MQNGVTQWVKITCSAVLSPVHLNVCGKSQEHSTPAFVIFGHSQTVSDEGEDAWDGSLTFPPSPGLFMFDEFAGNSSALFTLDTVVNDVVEIAFNVVSSSSIARSSFVASMHDASVSNRISQH